MHIYLDGGPFDGNVVEKVDVEGMGGSPGLLTGLAFDKGGNVVHIDATPGPDEIRRREAPLMAAWRLREPATIPPALGSESDDYRSGYGRTDRTADDGSPIFECDDRP